MAKKKDSIDHSGTGGEKNGAEAEPEFSDPEGFVDDINDEEFCGDLLRRKPRETEGVESIIVVDGLPVVGEDRLEKLKGVVRTIFGKFGATTNEFFAIGDHEAVATAVAPNTTLPTTQTICGTCGAFHEKTLKSFARNLYCCGLAQANILKE